MVFLTISLQQIEQLLKENKLLKEFTHENSWHYDLPIENKTLTHLSYDSRNVTSETLFFCKGASFKEEYLMSALTEGLQIYVSEIPFDVDAHLGIIVTDIRKAMAILSMAFYDYPQSKLKLVAFTGTKGKTTSAYFLKYMLDEYNNQKTAMFSTMNSTLDGKTYFKSHLTTPESLDLYRMMNEAVTNGMTHLVMEVSSQAYKLNRVYQLTFDIGIFLNISPDHISPIEHPTFDDYYYCKRQLIHHSKQFIVNLDTRNVQLILEEAQNSQIPTVTYSATNKQANYHWEKGSTSTSFEVKSNQDSLNLCATYELGLMGDFNKDNALASIIAARLLDVPIETCQKGLKKATVPGRMEQLIQKNGSKVYIDYAHNKVSLTNLLSFAKQEHHDGRIITVIGSTGDKAISRRKDFGEVLNDYTDVAILTSDDPGNEHPHDIAKEISRYIVNDSVEQHIELDRETAIKKALSMATSQDTVIIAGKGRDLYQKIAGEDVAYAGDFTIAERTINE